MGLDYVCSKCGTKARSSTKCYSCGSTKMLKLGMKVKPPKGKKYKVSKRLNMTKRKTPSVRDFYSP